MAGHSHFQFILGGAALKVYKSIQGNEPKNITMSAARRARATVTYFIKIIGPFHRAKRDRIFGN